MIERDDKIDDESHSDGDNQTYIINHRSMRITVLNSQNDSITTDDEYENVKDILLNYIENLFLIDLKMSDVSTVRENLEKAIDKFRIYIVKDK